jgi:hypothetical protein
MIRNAIVASLLATFVAGAPLPDHNTIGVIVPAYFSPGKLWAQMVADKKAHPRVPLFIIANINSGPGTKLDPEYTRAIRDAQAAGITVVGYVYTKYAKRPAAAVTADIARWESWYKIDGILLDEMKSEPGSEAYYQSLTQALHVRHRITIGNPGTTVAKSYDATVDILMIHESPGFADGAASGLPPKQLASISTNLPTLDLAPLCAQRIGLIYPTDENAPPTYARLPRYFDKLIEQLDSPPASDSN